MAIEDIDYIFLEVSTYSLSKNLRGDFMKFVILLGSPHLNGNTATICKPFIKELKAKGQEINYITLSDKKILVADVILARIYLMVMAVYIKMICIPYLISLKILIISYLLHQSILGIVLLK